MTLSVSYSMVSLVSCSVLLCLLVAKIYVINVAFTGVDRLFFLVNSDGR